MLEWVAVLLVIALAVGFLGLVAAPVEMMRIAFFFAVVMFLISAVVGLARGRTRV